MKHTKPLTNEKNTMRLQYQLATGNWVDCGARTEEFLALCEEFSKQDREGVLSDLAAGKKVRNDRSDWYSVCRDGEYYDARLAAHDQARANTPMRKCSCGHTIAENLVMSASMGTSCPDCYDRMSD